MNTWEYIRQSKLHFFIPVSLKVVAMHKTNISLASTFEKEKERDTPLQKIFLSTSRKSMFSRPMQEKIRRTFNAKQNVSALRKSYRYLFTFWPSSLTTRPPPLPFSSAPPPPPCPCSEYPACLPQRIPCLLPLPSCSSSPPSPSPRSRCSPSR